MTYLVFTDVIDNNGYSIAEHSIESDNRELEVIVALMANKTSDDPDYTDDWPGWDGETKSYYIEDPNVLHQVAQQWDVAVEILEY